MARQKATFAHFAVPFMGFMIVGWLGLASLVQTKREVKQGTRGLDSVEEMDPVERMRRRFELDAAVKAGGHVPAREPPRIPSLEEELEAIKRKVNIYDFDYKPVPRPADDE